MRLPSITLLPILLTVCTAKVWEISVPKTLQECYNKVQHANIETFVGSTYSWLCETAIKKSQQSGPPTFDSQKMGYYDQLYSKCIEVLPGMTGRRRVRGKRQAGRPPCVRREYRMLSAEERTRFHDAVNALKRDTTVEPNKYDAIALLHTGLASFTAHGGAGFPGWHRIYILMFEAALREVDPTVCLPYWDSSLDADLEEPTDSPIWTPEFFGTPQGPVVEGPFADWMTPEGVQLIRNVGADGELFTREAIEDILSMRSHADIVTSAETEPRFDLEFHHAAVHVFCGGTMGQLDTAAFDPVFFMHHAFVDYLWELFRTNLRSLGVDPEIYPNVEDADSRHHSTAETGFGDLTHADGYSDNLMEDVQYEASPICSSRYPECGSQHLACHVNLGRCVPVFPDVVFPPNPTPNPRPTPRPGPVNPNPLPTPTNPNPSPGSTCSVPKFPKNVGLPNQNTYCCDGSCDTSEWAHIPVKIVNVRPPKFSSYRSFPVKNGQVVSKNDIYSPSAYAQTNRFISRRQGNPKTYQRCADDSSTGQVFLSSQGINYNGYYKESTIVDQRLAVSISMGYIAVKRPTRGKRGVTKALVRAHDSCGRECHAACKDATTGEYTPCTGAIAVSTESPRMYGKTYDDAVMSVFDYQFNNDCPNFKTENFFITFYCDYHNDFPYAEHHHGPEPAPPRPPVIKPLPVPVPTSREGCRVTRDCTLDVPCVSQFRQCNIYNDQHRCRGSCRAYGVCTYGRYFLRLCPQGQYYDDASHKCITGFCRKVAGQGRVLTPSSGRRRTSSGGSYQQQRAARMQGHAEHTHSQVVHSHSDVGHAHSHSNGHSAGPVRPYYSRILSGFLKSVG